MAKARGKWQKTPEVPQGALKGSRQQLLAAGCIQAEVDERYLSGLLVATGGNPCDGCPKWESSRGQCLAAKRFHTGLIAAEQARQEAAMRNEQRILDARTAGTKNSSGRFVGLTVRQIAGELGVSQSEVRRLKVAGKLETAERASV